MDRPNSRVRSALSEPNRLVIGCASRFIDLTSLCVKIILTEKLSFSTANTMPCRTVTRRERPVWLSWRERGAARRLPRPRSGSGKAGDRDMPCLFIRDPSHVNEQVLHKGKQVACIRGLCSRRNPSIRGGLRMEGVLQHDPESEKGTDVASVIPLTAGVESSGC